MKSDGSGLLLKIDRAMLMYIIGRVKDGHFFHLFERCVFLWLPLFARFGFCLSAVLLNGRIRGVGVVSDAWPFINNVPECLPGCMC